MVIFPSPTSALPDHDWLAPTPSGGPSKADFMLGSSLAQGDQASHLCKLLTWGKISAGKAFTVAERETVYSAGCIATNPKNTATTAPTPIKILFLFCML